MRLNLVPEMDWRETGASGEPETAGVDWVPSQVARGEAVSYLLLDLLSVSCFRGECTCLSVCMSDCMYVCFFVYGAYAQSRLLFESTDVCVHFFFMHVYVYAFRSFKVITSAHFTIPELMKKQVTLQGFSHSLMEQVHLLFFPTSARIPQKLWGITDLGWVT